MEDLILQPVIQYGFLGFSIVLLCIIVWLIRRLLAVLDATNRVIDTNTDAIRDLNSTTATLINMTSDLLKLNRSLHDKIISRPCIAG